MTKLTPEQLKERHQEGMMEDLMETSNKWFKGHGIDPKEAADPIFCNRCLKEIEAPKLAPFIFQFQLERV